MSYIESSLIKDERIVSLFPLHWSAWIPVACWGLAVVPLVLGIAMGATTFTVVGAIGVFVAIVKMIKLKGLERAVTSRRLVQKRGVISRTSDEIQLTSIETVEISQSILGRIFGAGAVKVTGRGISDLVLSNVDDPMGVKKRIESAA